MSPEEVLTLARQRYDAQVYPDDVSVLFVMLVDVAQACEQSMAKAMDPLSDDRRPGEPLSLAQTVGPRDSMVWDLIDNLEYREGDRS